MSSRLFQNVREKRGLAYAVFSGLSAYRDAGSMTIYAGCANSAIGELIDIYRRELGREGTDLPWFTALVPSRTSSEYHNPMLPVSVVWTASPGGA